MAENDIYDSKAKYESFISRLEAFGKKPEERVSRTKGNRGKYFCRNAVNLEYFRKLCQHFEARDISYIRRLRLLQVMKLICHSAKLDLKDCNREEIDAIAAFSHQRCTSVKTKQDFITDIKHLWKLLFPEKDERGRIDSTIVPYPVRHLSARIDKSKEKLRNDRLTPDEFEKLVKAFAGDIRIQAFITLAHESLARPQELLYVRLRGVELFDNYAKVWISEHGKEGTGFLQCIDSYSYVASWMNQHPLRHDPNAFFFINLGDFGRYKQLRPETINKHLREKLRLLGIDKRVTCYSLKRNGVTFRRLRGDSDVTIQHVARWTSTKQLRAYDLSQPEDTFKIELAKRGLIDDEKFKEFQPGSKKCVFCGVLNGIGNDICERCKRPLDRKKITAMEAEKVKELEAERNERLRLSEEFRKLKEQFGRINSFMNKLVDENPEVLDYLARKGKQSKAIAQIANGQQDS